MFFSFVKIFIKFSFLFFTSLQLTQDILSMEDECSDIFIDSDKENCSHGINVKKSPAPSLSLNESPLKSRSLNLTPFSENKSKHCAKKHKEKRSLYASEASDFEKISSQEGVKKRKKELTLIKDPHKKPLRIDLSPSDELPTETPEKLRELKLDPAQAMAVFVLNSTLHKEMRVNPFIKLSSPLRKNRKRGLELDYTTLSPAKVNELVRVGGNIDDLKAQVFQLKTEFPSPIRNPKYPLGPVYSPAVRHAGVPRLLLHQGRKERILHSLAIDYHIAPFTPETPEEHEARKKQQFIDFLEVEKLRGKVSEEQIAEILTQSGRGRSKEAIAEVKREIEIWQDHLNYIGMRKNQITGGTLELLDEDEFEDESDGDDSFLSLIPEAGSDAEVESLDPQQNEKVKKIRKAEIEDAFENFVAGKLIRLDVEGYELWFSKEIDLDREDGNGETNLERMARGLCPIGADGETMNFHHLTHYDFKTHKIRSIIVPLTEHVHKKYPFHFGRNTYQDLPRKKVNRNEWNKVRPLFNKALAEYFASLSK